MDYWGNQIDTLRLKLLENRINQLEKIKENNKNQNAKLEAAHKFESYFIEYILNTMQKTVDIWKDKENNTEQVYMSMVFRALSDKITRAGGFGLSNYIVKHLDGNSNTKSSLMKLEMPLNGPISSAFGWRKDPFSNREEFHKGIDIAVPIGTKVKATAEGKVIWAGEKKGLGKTIIIRHQGGVESVYGHLSKIEVHEGETVSLGTTVGKSGNSGRSTGPHLHFEILYHGRAVDPLRFL